MVVRPHLKMVAMANPADLYNEQYYKSHCGPVPYARDSPAIVNFFSAMADHLVRSLNPRTVMDAGCAMGFLVEGLRDRGVEAWGVDLSPYAISQVRMDMTPYCRVASLTEPIFDRYDLITCIEVLEHMPEEEALQAIKGMTGASDTILFSSSPDDFAEPTHVNVRQPMWWMDQFQRFGFTPDLTFECSFVSPQALLFRKTDAPLDYEVRRLYLNYLRAKLRAFTSESRVQKLTGALQVAQTSGAESSAVGAEGAAAPQAELMELRDRLSAETARLATSEAEVADLKGSMAQAEARMARLANDVAALNAALNVYRSQQGEGGEAKTRVEEPGSDISGAMQQAANLELGEKERDEMNSELAKMNATIQSLTAGQQALAGEFAAASAEVEDLRQLISRSDRRGTIFLQQLEQSEAGLQEMRKSLNEQTSRWERNLNGQKAMSSGMEHRCAQISGRLESLEPRVGDIQLRVEELNRLQLSTHQQVSGLTTQVREILGSRIWQALVKGGGMILKLTGRGK